MQSSEMKTERGQHSPNSSNLQSIGKAQAIIALVCGIVGLVLFFVLYIGLVGDIVGIVLGAIYRRRRPEGAYRDIATAGFVTGIVGLGLSTLGFLFGLLFMYARVAGSGPQ